MSEEFMGPTLQELQETGVTEKEQQEYWGRTRSTQFVEIRKTTAEYVAQSVIENAHGKTAIDLACGDGRMMDEFKKRFDRIVGVDGSNFQIERAREKYPDLEFHDSLIEDFESDDKFDTVMLVNVLEHVYDPVQVLKKSASFMEEDGRLLVYVPNANALNRKIAYEMGTIESLTELSPYDLKSTGHRRYYNLETLQADIEAAGLKVESSGGVFLRMLSFAQMDWFLSNGPWEEGGFGWGRVGAEKEKDWKKEFARACYEVGKQHPDECNCVFIRAQKK